MHKTCSIRIAKNMKFHKTVINKLHMMKKKITSYRINQNTIAKISLKEIRFFKNALHKESTVPKHSVFLLLLQHFGINIHIKTVKLMKNISIFLK